MKKHQRLIEIEKLVNRRGVITVAEIVEMMNVSDMTIRRDLAVLEEQGLITRIHGGARSIQQLKYREGPHEEKLYQHIEEKRKVASKAAKLIQDGETIFLGPGTSVEILAEEIQNEELRVVTNCLPIFNELYKKSSDTFKVILLGGEMRNLTQAFVGEITNALLDRMYYNKMFFSGNGIKDGQVMTSSFEEAFTQRLAIEKSSEAYLLMDSSKIGKEDFTSICSLENVTAVITDISSDNVHDTLEVYTQVIV